MDNFALDNTKEELGVGDAVLVTETVDGEVVVRKVGYAFKMVPLKTLCSVGTISKSLLLCRSLWYTKSKIHRKHEINLHWNQVFNNFIFYHNLLHITGKKTIQPIIKDNIVILFNGEIYNYKDLGSFSNELDLLHNLYNRSTHHSISKFF